MRLKKSLGQHFLNNPSIAARIVDLLAPEKNADIIEIGPGGGALTRHIAQRNPARFVLLEKDEFFVTQHTQQWQNNDNIQVIHGDALLFDWAALRGSWNIIGNLPYNIASPLIWDIAGNTSHLHRAVFMVQREVGQRLAAVPHTRDYGALSVWVQSFTKVSYAFTVPPGAFTPAPKVESAVVRLDPQPRGIRPEDQRRLAEFVKMCFQQRRKQLLTILKNNGVRLPEKILSDLDINPKSRPEELSVEQFQLLSKKYDRGQ
jgi:16S rRNA (adenine1518-N6/adenine1519-N6)-dimethyltransferase